MIVDVSRGVVGRDMVFASVFDVETHLNFNASLNHARENQILK